MAGKLHSPMLAGLAVATVIASGGISIPVEIPAWGVPDLPTGGTLDVALTVYEGLNSGRTAPHYAAFDVAVTGFDGEDEQTEFWRADFHRVWYRHDFGDPGTRFTVAERIDDAHKDRNTAIGQMASHVYRTPGKHFYYVMCYDRAGNWGAASHVVEVIADDFTENETVVIDPDGDFMKCPLAAPRNRLTSWDEFHAWAPVSGVTRVKVWMRRGKMYPRTVSATKNFSYNLTIAAFGSGAKPVLDDPGNGRILGTSPSLKCSGVHFQGPWDSTNEILPGSDPRANTGICIHTGSRAEILFDGCSDNGTSVAFEINIPEGHFCLHEHKRENHKDFLALCTAFDGYVSIVGCSEVQVPTALNGSMDRDVFNNGNSEYRYLRDSHNGCRFPYVKNLIYTNVDQFGRQGWTFQNFIYDNAVLRINTGLGVNDISGLDSRVIINRCHIEGDIANAHQSSGYQAAANLMMEATRWLLNPTSGTPEFGQTGWTIRDCLCIIGNTPSPGGVPAAYAFARIGDTLPGATSEWDTHNEAYNNTFVDLRTPSNGGVEAFDLFRPFREGIVILSGNNTLYRPNVAAPVDDSGPLDLTSLGYEARYAGVRCGYHHWQNHHTLSEAVVDGASVVVPYGTDNWLPGTPQTTQADFAGSWVRNGVRVGLVGVTVTLSESVSNGGAVVETVVSGAGGAFTFAADVINNRVVSVPALFEGVKPNAAQSKTGFVTALHDQFRGSAGFAFEVGGIRITNLSGRTWPSGTVMRSVTVDRGTTSMAMDTRYAIPAGTMRLYGITEASAAFEDAGEGMVSLTDFWGRPRPGSGHALAGPGTPSRGAYEVAA